MHKVELPVAFSSFVTSQCHTLPKLILIVPYYNQKKFFAKKCLKKVKLAIELFFLEMVQVVCEVQVTPFYGMLRKWPCHSLHALALYMEYIGNKDLIL